MRQSRYGWALVLSVALDLLFFSPTVSFNNIWPFLQRLIYSRQLASPKFLSGCADQPRKTRTAEPPVFSMNWDKPATLKPAKARNGDKEMISLIC